MKLLKSPYGKYIYAFEFNYLRDVVERLQKLKDDPNGADLVYTSNAWRFTDLAWVNKIKNELWEFQIEVSDEITQDLKRYSIKKEEEFERLNKIYTLKNTLESDYSISNIKGDPWPFQRVGVEFIEATDGRCIIADEMGSGKTMQTLCYIAHNNLKKTVVVCPAIAKGVWYNETLKWTNLKPCILNGKSKLTMEMWQDHDIFIINYDIIGVRASKKDKNVKRNKFCEFFNTVRVDLLVADEVHRCFPYDTLIDTSNGKMKIGDIVNSSDEIFVRSCNSLDGVVYLKRVTNRFKNPKLTKLVKIKHRYGELTCTETHKIWTSEGYKEAQTLKSGDSLWVLQEEENGHKKRKVNGKILQSLMLIKEKLGRKRIQGKNNNINAVSIIEKKMRALQEGIYIKAKWIKKQKKKVLWKQLCSKMENGSTRIKEAIHKRICEKNKRSFNWKKMSMGIGKNDKNEQGPRIYKKERRWFGKMAQRKSNILGSWWKRGTNRTSKTFGKNSWCWKTEYGIRHINEFCKRKIQLFAELLQGGYRNSRKDASNRGRWEQPQEQKMEISRQKKRKGIKISRVESIEVLEQRSARGCKGSGEKDKHVYDIEVEDYHNYFAEGVLVSNCKNIKSARTMAVIGLSRKIDRFIGLSGTPLLNRPLELYTTLNILDPQEWNNPYGFIRRYCQKGDGKMKTVYTKDKKTGKAKKIKVLERDGASNIDELRRRIGSYYIRRTKDQILPFLPEKVETLIDIEFDPKMAKLYKETERVFIDSVNDGDANGMVGMVKLNELRQISSLGKIEKITEFIEDLKQDQKVIVFSSFNEPLRQLRDYFGEECVYVTGETESEKKTELAKKFCEDPAVRVFLGGTISAGESLTLVEARSTIFIDYPWVPGQKDQASDRNHRPGAEKLHDSLNIYQMYTSGTVDERMRAIIYGKKKIFDALFAKDPTKAEKSAKQAIINSYRS